MNKGSIGKLTKKSHVSSHRIRSWLSLSPYLSNRGITLSPPTLPRSQLHPRGDHHQRRSAPLWTEQERDDRRVDRGERGAHPFLFSLSIFSSSPFATCGFPGFASLTARTPSSLT